jgi:hypothetical protein
MRSHSESDIVELEDGTRWRDWRDPHFAACDSLETSETHVFGDVIFRSEPVAVEGRKRTAEHR